IFVPAPAPVAVAGVRDQVRPACVRRRPWPGRQARAPHQRRAPAIPAGGLEGVSGLGPVLLAEALHASGRVDQLLLAREERMAGSTDVEMDLVLGGASLERVAARTLDRGGSIHGMDICLH